MEKILPIMSVQKKIKKKMSVLVGNYEFYYAAGIFVKRFGKNMKSDISYADIKPDQLKDVLENALSNITKNNAGDEEETEYLFYLLQRYEPEEKYDEIMPELFSNGMEDAEGIYAGE